MPLHPEIAKALATLPPPPAGPLDPPTMRAAEHAPAGDGLPQPADDVTVGDVPVRIYNAAAPRTLVYFHGGAFFLGSLDTHDHIARSLAKETGRRVVSVGYRLAPEHAFPAGLDDCYAVVRWAAANETVAIAGDSSGGNFVAAVAATAHDGGFDRISHQILYYPSLDLDFDEDRYPSLRENATGYGLETAGLKPFNAFYLASGADPADPKVSPIKRKNLTGLPPALIITGELDPLRDEGELYGRRLQEAAVDATVSRYAGAGHGFVQHFSWIPDYYRAFEETAAFLREDEDDK
ncbi:alpha/beta hydrolase [Actinoplanes sp. CA-142083]|uniref:alpha/beta hydrolase n=1 Tax=Actinoplanes sp. CA-142083 TaxID=3239903 RepID=UPI003D9410F8